MVENCLELSVSVDDVMSWGPCEGYPRERVEEIFAGRARLSAAECLDMDGIPAEDRLWVVLRPELIPEKILHLLSCDFAAWVLPLFEGMYQNDKRPRKAIEAKEKWLAGKICTKELVSASNAAGAAAEAVIIPGKTAVMDVRRSDNRHACRWAACSAASTAARAARPYADSTRYATSAALKATDWAVRALPRMSHKWRDSGIAMIEMTRRRLATEDTEKD